MVSDQLQSISVHMNKPQNHKQFNIAVCSLVLSHTWLVDSLQDNNIAGIVGIHVFLSFTVILDRIVLQKVIQYIQLMITL